MQLSDSDLEISQELIEKMEAQDVNFFDLGVFNMSEEDIADVQINELDFLIGDIFSLEDEEDEIVLELAGKFKEKTPENFFKEVRLRDYPEKITKKFIELIGKDNLISVLEQIKNKNLFKKIEQFLDLFNFKKTNSEHDDAYCSIKELPLLASLFEKEAQMGLMRSEVLQQWWNDNNGIYKQNKLAFFSMPAQTNGEMVKQLIDSDQKLKLLERNYEIYISRIIDLANVLTCEMRRYEEHSYARLS